jgi:5-methylcytosine-specific restriction endonuclease McrA
MEQIIPENVRIARERASRWYYVHREEVLLHRKESYRLNSDIKKIKVKEYRKCHPEKDRDKTRKRRALKRHILGGHFTEKEFIDLKKSYGNKCLCCGTDKEHLYPDHVVPLSLNLPHSDEISNIQPLCVSCNGKKHTKTIDYRNPMLLES